VTHPLTSLSFSLTERAVYQLGIFLGFAGISQLVPVPAVSALGYLAVTYLLQALVHSNVEVVPAWLVRSPLGRLVGTVSFHAMHHARGTRHYGFTTPILDYAFHTVWDDYPEVHARAAAGVGNPV
jgi:sterol desaturase/sphingolipid hydroxylase (fatty acid hydroxylase superfamily)